MTKPNVTVAPKRVCPLSKAQPPEPTTMASATYESASRAGASADVYETARTLASRLAALTSLNCSMFSSARLNACTSRTAAMDSCNSALTLPISLRLLRKALRACAEKYKVTMNITGVIESESRANGRLAVSMLYATQTNNRTPLNTLM